MSEEQEHVRIGLPGETVWATVVDADKGHYKIDNAPLFEDVRFGDVVRATNCCGRLEYVSVVDRTYVQAIAKYDFEQRDPLMELRKTLQEECKGQLGSEGYTPGFLCFFATEDLPGLEDIRERILACPAVEGMEPWHKEPIPAVDDA